MTTPTDDELDALVARGRKALEGVTPGSWSAKERGKHPNPYVCGAPQEYEFGIDRPVVAYFTGMNIEKNSRFTADARDLVPELTDAITALRAELAAERAKVEAMIDALVWCSGSPDFQVEGIARLGWEKLCAPLLKGATK